MSAPARGRPPTPPAGSADPATPSSSGGHVRKQVFIPAVVVIAAFVLLASVFPDATSAVWGELGSAISTGLGWYYILIVAVFVVFTLGVAFSRWGSLRLGPENEKPEFGARSWFAMLFSAGMGIGLVFYGVAEPLTYYANPRPGVLGGGPESSADYTAAQSSDIGGAALAQTYVHWGLHPWAIYVVMGLAIAFAVHRKGRPISIRWALEPLLGERRVRGWIGDTIDVIAIIGTVFGVATSLGLGILQLSAGLGFYGISTDGLTPQLLLIAAITGLATISVITGLTKGIKFLSNVNMVLATVLLLFVVIAGPTLFIFREFVASFGYYLSDVVGITFNTAALSGEAGQSFLSAWTIFYWGWWISWSPFVGVFIARISRGRTVREFILGAMAVPTLVSFAWFSAFGGAALFRQVQGDGGLLGGADAVDFNLSLFQLLEGLPFGTIAAVVALILIVTFFVTSSDSASLVVDMLASGGSLNPPVWSRVFWAVTEGAVAAILLVIGAQSGANALGALQTASIATAVPVSVVLVLLMFAVAKGLSGDWRALEDRRRMSQEKQLIRQVAEEIDTAPASDGPSARRTPAGQA